MSSTPSENPVEGQAQWRSRAVERSTSVALAKAMDRSDRYIASAFQLLEERGSDFSVQDVVDLSRTSLRTFYQSFEGKDDLFLAIYEEGMISGLARQKERAAAAGGDPADRLRAFLLAEWDMLSDGTPRTNRALAVYHQRLAETRPAELAAALSPQHAALTAIVADCREADLVRNDLTDADNALMLVHLLTSTLQAKVMDVHIGDVDPSPDLLWGFVSATFGPAPTAKATPRAKQKAKPKA